MPDIEELNYVIPVNLAGVLPVDVLMQDPPGGAYECEITDSRKVTREGEGGKVTLRFMLSVVEDGPAKGMSTMAVLGTDWSKPFNVRHLKNLLYGMGVNPEKIERNLDLVPDLFRGRRCFLYVKPAPEGELDDSGRPARPTKNFLTKEMYAQAKRAPAPTPAPARTGPHAVPPSNGRPATPALPTRPPPAGAELEGLFS